MPRILISYRRSDSAGICGRIVDRLSAHYGKDSVFVDIHDVPYGVDFRKHIKDAMLRSDALLVIIGTDWLGRRPDGFVRMEDESDPVRIEVETALRHELPLIPVLVGGATMPQSSELPPQLAALAYRNAAPLDPGRDFDEHMRRLIERIDELLGLPHPQPAAEAGGRLAPGVPPPGAIRGLWSQLQPRARFIGGALAVIAVLLLLASSRLIGVNPLTLLSSGNGNAPAAGGPQNAGAAELIVSPLSEDRARPLDGYPVLAKHGRTYTGGARVALSLSHNQAGNGKITVRRITPMINFMPGEDPSLAYTVASNAIGGSGITEPNEFVIRLNGSSPPTIAWITRTGREPARPDNILALEPPKLVRLDPNDNVEDFEITLIAMQGGLYDISFEIGYTVDGLDRVQRTDSIRIYSK